MASLEELQAALAGTRPVGLIQIRINNNYTRRRLADELMVDPDDIRYLETLPDKCDVAREAALYTMFFETSGMTPSITVTNESGNTYPISYFIGTWVEQEATNRKARNGAPFAGENVQVQNATVNVGGAAMQENPVKKGFGKLFG